MILSKEGDTGNCKIKNYIALCGEIASEGALDRRKTDCGIMMRRNAKDIQSSTCSRQV